VRVFRFVVMMTLVAAPWLAAAQQPAPVEPEPEVLPAGIEELRATIQEILDEADIPGASVALVSRDATIWAGGVGKADLAADIDVTGDTLFRVGSISKSCLPLSRQRPAV
jgi:CubicO group peptidase (beta-lactamase class C family)